MTHDFSDLTPTHNQVLQWIENAPSGIQLIQYIADESSRWGAEQAAERLKGQWPDPITGRPPTEADGDDMELVQYRDSDPSWRVIHWAHVGHRAWLHTPRWQPPAPLTLKQKGLFSLAVLQSYDETCTPAEMEEHWSNIRRALENAS